MYTIQEILFMIMYFGGLTIAYAVGLALAQLIVYQLTGISIYRAITNVFNMLFNSLNKLEKYLNKKLYV